MEFDKTLVYHADFAMENSKVTKSRMLNNIETEVFKMKLKELCAEHGLKADSVLIFRDFKKE